MSRWTKTLLGLGIFAAALHLGTINNELTFDDHRAIERNPTTAEPLHVWAHVAGGFWGPGYQERDAAWRPLTTLTLAWNRAAHDVRPAGYHGVNILLHALAVVFLALLARSLGLRDEYALAAAALFAVHPLHVDAIAPGVGRADLLLGVFGLAAFVAWERRRTALALVALALALLSKEMAVMLAGVLVWRELTRGSERAPWRWAYPLAVVAVWLVARYAVLGGFGGAHPGVLENSAAGGGIAGRLWAAGDCYRMALQLFWAPITLVADYSYATLEPAAGFTSLLGLILLAGTVAATIGTARRAPAASAMLALWVGPYLLVSHLGPTLPMLFAERVLYLPTAGLCLLVGYALSRAADRPALRRGAAVTFVAVCVAFAARSYARIGDWQNDATLQARTAEDAPRNVKALTNWARALAAAGRMDDAVAATQRALDVRDDVALPHLTAAGMHIQLGDAQRAAEHLRRAEQLNPDLAGFAETSCAFTAQFHPARAIDECIAATRAPYAQPDAWMFLAIAYDRNGDPANADEAFRIAIGMAANPDLVLVHNYGIFLLRNRRYRPARAMLLRARELAPDRADIRRQLEHATRGEVGGP